MNSFTTDAIGNGLVVTVGHDLAGVAVHYDGRDVGAGLGGVGSGLPGAVVQSVEGGGGLVGWGLRQGSHGALRRDDGQVRPRGLRRGSVHPGLATDDDGRGEGDDRNRRDQLRRPPSHCPPLTQPHLQTRGFQPNGSRPDSRA